MIVLEGAVELVPPALFEQLKNGGRLVCVLGRGAEGKATLYRRMPTTMSAGARCSMRRPRRCPGFAKPAQFVF